MEVNRNIYGAHLPFQLTTRGGSKLQLSRQLLSLCSRRVELFFQGRRALLLQRQRIEMLAQRGFQRIQFPTLGGQLLVCISLQGSKEVEGKSAVSLCLKKKERIVK